MPRNFPRFSAASRDFPRIAADFNAFRNISLGLQPGLPAGRAQGRLGSGLGVGSVAASLHLRGLLPQLGCSPGLAPAPAGELKNRWFGNSKIIIVESQQPQRMSGRGPDLTPRP